jgi:hypothetical protein
MKSQNSSIEFSERGTKNYTYVSPVTLDNSFPVLTENIFSNTELSANDFIEVLQRVSRRVSEPES